MIKATTIINSIKALERKAIQAPLLPRQEAKLSSLAMEGYAKVLSEAETNYGKALVNAKPVVGKHKIPRYLYHVTTKKSYEKMLETGSIKDLQACDGRGVFLFDLRNFVKQWKETKEVVEQPRTSLLALISGTKLIGSGDIVMLRIPTSILDARTLKIRRQKLLRCGAAGQQEYINQQTKNPYKISESLKEMIAMDGETALNAKLYRQKEAIEYIATHSIPIDKVQLVGATKLDGAAVKMANADKKDMPEVWKALTVGQPESNVFELLI